MKKNLSVLMLFVRSVLYPALLLIGLMGIAEIVLFCAIKAQGGLLLPELLDNCYLTLLFREALIFITVLLLRTGGEYGVRTGYTLRRLSISEERVFVWQAVCNTLFFLLLWLAQALIALGLGWYFTATTGTANHQTLVLAAYQSNVLHSLLPMENWLVWIRNVLLCLGLGLAAAHFPYRQRRKKLSPWVFGLLAVGLFLFFTGAENDPGPTWFCIGASIFAIVIVCGSILAGKGECYEDEIPDTKET